MVTNHQKNRDKLQKIQNAALRTATGCTSDTNIQHLPTETKILPINDHLKLHASQLRQKAQLQSHPLNSLTKMKPSKKLKKLKRPIIIIIRVFRTSVSHSEE